MDAIRLKHLLAPEALTAKELMCLQIERHGFGCAPCSAQAAARGDLPS
jgi:hypothetical protein